MLYLQSRSEGAPQGRGVFAALGTGKMAFGEGRLSFGVALSLSVLDGQIRQFGPGDGDLGLRQGQRGRGVGGI